MMAEFLWKKKGGGRLSFLVGIEPSFGEVDDG